MLCPEDHQISSIQNWEALIINFTMHLWLNLIHVNILEWSQQIHCDAVLFVVNNINHYFDHCMLLNFPHETNDDSRHQNIASKSRNLLSELVVNIMTDWHQPLGRSIVHPSTIYTPALQKIWIWFLIHQNFWWSWPFIHMYKDNWCHFQSLLVLISQARACSEASEIWVRIFSVHANPECKNN